MHLQPRASAAHSGDLAHKFQKGVDADENLATQPTVVEDRVMATTSLVVLRTKTLPGRRTHSGTCAIVARMTAVITDVACIFVFTYASY